MLRQIDDVLYDNPIGVQKHSEWVKNLTGASFTSQAKFWAMCAFCVAVANSMAYPEYGLIINFLGLVTFSVILISVFVIASKLNASYKLGTVNSVRLSHRFMCLRLFMATSMVLMLFFGLDAFDRIGSLSLTMSYYLLGCQPAPSVFKKLAKEV